MSHQCWQRGLRRLCDAIEARAEDKGTIALYDEDYSEAHARVQALATEAELADDLHAPVEAWRARDRAWHEQRRAIEDYPARVQHLVEQGHALAAETRTSPDGDASPTQWRRDCRQVRRQGERMLADEDGVHRPHLDAREGARKGIERALGLLAEALLRDDYERLRRLGEALRARAANDGASASRDGEDAGWRARVEALAEDPGLPRDLRTPVPILARQARERAPETDRRPLQADFQPVTSDEPAYEESDTTVARNGKPGRPSTPAEAQRLAQEHLEGDKSTGRRALRELILEMGEQRLLGKRYQDPHDIQARLIPRAEDQSTDGERVDVYDFAAVQTDRSAGIAATIIVRHTDAIARERDDAPAANTVGQWRRRARECADEVIAAILLHEAEYWANRVGQGARETTQQPVPSLQAEPESAPKRVNEATDGHEARQRGTVSESGTIRAPTSAPRVEAEAAKPAPAPAVQASPVPARDLPQPQPVSPVAVEVPKPLPAAPVRTTPVPARDLPQPRPGPRLEVEAAKPVPAARVQALPVPAHHLPQPTPATPRPVSPMAAHRLPQPRQAPRVETGLEAADVQHAREALQARLPGKADEIARNRLHPRDPGTTTGPVTAIGAAHEPLAEVCLTEAGARAAGEILDTALDAIARRPSRGAAESKGDRLGRSEEQAGKEALYEWRLSAADIVARMIDVACIAEAIETRRRRREEHARSAARTDLNAEAERGRPLERSPSHGSKRGYGGYKR